MKNYAARSEQFKDLSKAKPKTKVKSTPSALDTQVGGNHYKTRKIQPIEYIHANDLDFFEGNVVKLITRWQDKGGVQDLHKAIHYLQLRIELESQK